MLFHRGNFSLQTQRSKKRPVKTLVANRPSISRSRPLISSYKLNTCSLLNTHVPERRELTRTHAAVDWDYLLSYSQRRVKDYVEKHKLKENLEAFIMRSLYLFEIALIQVGDTLRRHFLHIESEYHVLEGILGLSHKAIELWRDISQKYNLRKRFQYLVMFLIKSAPPVLEKLSLFYQSFYGRLAIIIALFFAIRARMFSKFASIASRIWILVFLVSMLLARIESLKRWHAKTTAGPRPRPGSRNWYDDNNGSKKPNQGPIYDSESGFQLPHESLLSAVLDFLNRRDSNSAAGKAGRAGSRTRGGAGAGSSSQQTNRGSGFGNAVYDGSSFPSGPVVFAEWKPAEGSSDNNSN